MNGYTALIRSLGTTGVLLLLALVLLAIVSAIVAFDRWPDGGRASTVDRVAVDRSELRRVETVQVAKRRSASVVRGAVAVRSPAGATIGALDAGDAILVVDGGRDDQSDGGGFGPPPPPVPFDAPGEGGGGAARLNNSGSSAPPAPPQPDETIVRRAACDARDALGEAGAALAPACGPGGRDIVREAGDTTTTDAVDAAVSDLTDLTLAR